ncbi:MAG TPA: HAMP domain-containing sensor histidine kinase [Tepiditoga sp.]|nr:HAMP domain-containing histidine kinase [Thermotogota bacterium]HOO74995.1 HAMP domain-containing sensor histidine kinase [Tepiditoga sp.]
MKKSIRSKLFVQITVLVLMFIGILFFVNTFFYDDYYHNIKRKELIEKSVYIEKIYEKEGLSDNFYTEAEKTESINNINIIITGENGRQIYDTNRKYTEDIQNFLNSDKAPQEIFKMPAPPPEKTSEKTEKLDDSTNLIYSKDVNLNISFLSIEKITSSGVRIVLRTTLNSINESVYISNRFIIYTGIFLMLFGIFYSFFLSKNFTKPILDINNIAKKIARMDFSDRYEIRDNDEIGELGKNINILSLTLKDNIDELNRKNGLLLEDLNKERENEKIRKEFISNVSHELKTPISIVKAYAEGLSEDINTESRKDYTEVIIDESNKMDKLVRELLVLSELNSGVGKISFSEFSLNELIKHVTDKFNNIVAGKDIKIEFESSENFIVYADMMKTEQILKNYISNAVNHTDKKKNIKIFFIDQKDKVAVNVYNSGNRLTDEQRKLIWQSFYKIDKSRSRAYGGSGLGLSIVKAVQDLHGNNCGVYNEEDGVVFWFDIKLNRKA